MGRGGEREISITARGEGGSVSKTSSKKEGNRGREKKMPGAAKLKKKTINLLGRKNVFHLSPREKRGEKEGGEVIGK